jgi:uncharacterized protein YndB with AHSA1/START domain
MFTIDHTIDISAPLAVLHAAITTEAGYRAWWTQDCDYDGKQATFRFTRASGTRAVTLRIDRADARGIAMTCTSQQNNPDWIGTTLAISLAETATGTRVRLVHAGFQAKNEHFGQCTTAWTFFLGSLGKYATTGAGEPFALAA